MRHIDELRRDVRLTFPAQSFITNYYRMTQKEILPHVLYIPTNEGYNDTWYELLVHKIYEYGYIAQDYEIRMSHVRVTLRESIIIDLAKDDIPFVRYMCHDHATITTLLHFLAKVNKL